MKRIIVFLIFIFLSGPLFAETIALKSGRQMNAKILEQTDKYIKIDFQNIPITYYLDEIESIDGKPIDNQKDYSTSTTTTTKDPQDIFETVSPGVVSIYEKTSSGEWLLGSGFIIDNRGIVVTNSHVLGFDKEIVVRLKDGKSYLTGNSFLENFPEISTISPSIDVSVFTINGKDLPVVTLDSAQNVKIGETIYCIGVPLEMENSFSNGILSGQRNIYSDTRYEGNIKLLQFTAPVSPGGSGGPILNSKGEVVGIVAAENTQGQNLNFAIPIDLAFGDIGCVYLMVRENEKAIDYFKKAIVAYPSNPTSFVFLGTAYANLGKYSEAKTNHLKAKELFLAIGDHEGVKRAEEYIKELP